MSNETGQQPTVIQEFLSGRREYLDAFDDLICTYSFLRRLWRRYLFWAVCFLRIRLGSYRRRMCGHVSRPITGPLIACSAATAICAT